MRKIFLFMMVSLDEYYAEPNGDISWPNVENEFNGFAVQQIREFDLKLIKTTTFKSAGNVLLYYQPAN